MRLELVQTPPRAAVGAQWFGSDHGRSWTISLAAKRSRIARISLASARFAVLNKYLAITAVDSGSFAPSDADRANGWTAEGGVAYSPRLQSIGDLPSHSCCRDCYGFDEWYIFDKRPVALGTLSHANPFTTEIARGNVFAFVNFGGFSLSDPVVGEVTNLFWRQVDWIEPHSYLADGQDHLIFATRDAALFAAVEDSLKPPSESALNAPMLIGNGTRRLSLVIVQNRAAVEC